MHRFFVNLLRHLEPRMVFQNVIQRLCTTLWNCTLLTALRGLSTWRPLALSAGCRPLHFSGCLIPPTYQPTQDNPLALVYCTASISLAKWIVHSSWRVATNTLMSQIDVDFIEPRYIGNTLTTELAMTLNWSLLVDLSIPLLSMKSVGARSSLRIYLPHAPDSHCLVSCEIVRRFIALN